MVKQKRIRMFQLTVWMPSDVSERVGRKIFLVHFIFSKETCFFDPTLNECISRYGTCVCFSRHASVPGGDGDNISSV